MASDSGKPNPPFRRERLQELLAAEIGRFQETHPRSRELYERAGRSMLGGVPMPWMMRWAGGFPVFAEKATGSRVIDVDGHEYVDLALGDTGSMAGHSPAQTAAAVAEQSGNGLTTMLPTEDSIVVAEELSRRFAMDHWIFTLSATDANRTALRLARQLTGRPKVLVYSYCYHGSVDETLAVGENGQTIPRAGNVGAPVDPAQTTVAVEFNDVDALERALAAGDVAIVLAEPAMTNMGIILPEPGYMDALRDLTRRHGTILLIDETHTFSEGPGGCTASWGLEPDLFTIGKAIGGGVPCGALGLSAELTERVLEDPHGDYEDTGGVGGTLAGNPLSAAAMRATLTTTLDEASFSHTIPLAGRFAEGVNGTIERTGVPWNVTRLGCRAEYQFLPEPARNGTEAFHSHDDELERYLHAHALNRGLIITPFHNMALMAPATSEADVDLHTRLFSEAVEALVQ